MMNDLISREHMKSLGATCIASRSKDGNMFSIVSIDELPPADLTHPTSSNTLGALDCVDRQAAIDACTDRHGICIAKQRLLELPSAQPERKKGKWIKDIERFGDNAYHCSQCGAVLEKDDLEWRNNYYCYHCGSDMRGEKDETE